MQTLAGNEHEGSKLEEIFKEDKSKGIEGSGVVADKLYDSIDNRKGVRELGKEVFIRNYHYLS